MPADTITTSGAEARTAYRGQTRGSIGVAALVSAEGTAGLEHRAAWVEAEADGTVTRLLSQVGVDPAHDPDTAVLAMLLAA